MGIIKELIRYAIDCYSIQPDRRVPRSRLDHWRHVCTLARAEGRPAPRFTDDWDRRGRPRP